MYVCTVCVHVYVCTYTCKYVRILNYSFYLHVCGMQGKNVHIKRHNYALYTYLHSFTYVHVYTHAQLYMNDPMAAT